MQSDKKQISGILVTILALLFMVVLLDYLFYNHFLYPSSRNDKIMITVLKLFQPIMEKDYILRILYVISVFIFVNVSPSMHLGKNMKKEDQFIYITLCVILTFIFIVGFIKFPIYDIFCFPIILVVHIYVTAKAFSLLRPDSFDDEVVFGVNQNKNGKCVFKLKLDESEKSDYIFFPHANSGCIVEGSTNSGKSASIIKQMIAQAAEEGYAGLIYDYNGNPTEDKSPILTRVALYGIYKGIEKSKRTGKEFKTQLAFLNFNDLSKSVRVNPLDSEYIKTKLDIINISTALMKNLEVTWKEKVDFWGQNAIQILTAGIHYLHKNYPSMCDFPHVIALLLSPHVQFIKLIASDAQVCRDFMPVYSAYISKAEGQIAGAVASAQGPLSKLNSPEIFWVLSKNELNLDITDKENPKLLCVGNDPNLAEALSGVISVIALVCMKNMNRPNRVKSIFCFDEIPTIVLYNVDKFIGVCRKYLVCSIFGVQTHSQFKRDYGDKSADVIRGACGNSFFGYTNELSTAEYISNSIGTIKKRDLSYTDGDNSNSTSQRMNNEKALQPRDVMNQPIGHFTGKVMGGKPVNFSCQFDFFRPEEEDDNYIAYTEIPSFANYYESDDPLKSEAAFLTDVRKNYEKIFSDITFLLNESNKEENIEKAMQNVYKYTTGLNIEQKKELLETMGLAMGTHKKVES